jgi:hypothetical protein
MVDLMYCPNPIYDHHPRSLFGYALRRVLRTLLAALLVMLLNGFLLIMADRSLGSTLRISSAECWVHAMGEVEYEDPLLPCPPPPAR